MLKRLKYSIAEKIKQHPYTMSVVWNRLPRLSFLLPHDRSYLGIPHIATETDGLFLDIGANNGISAAGFRKLNKCYKILSLEANALHQQALESLKKRLTDFDYRILAVGRAAGNLTLITPVYKGRAVHTHTSSSRDYLATSLGRDFTNDVVASMNYIENQVPVTSVDKLALQPDIVKIDVEGFDYDVLLGMQETISRCRPYCLVEFTPDHMQDCLRFFEKYNYYLYVYETVSNAFRRFDQVEETRTWKHEHLQVNIYCVPAERANKLPKTK